MKPILLALLILFPQSAAAAVFPQLSGDVYVIDQANVLTESQEQEILELGRGLDDATTAQLSVFTVQSLEGEPIESFALEAHRHYGLGTEEEDNGVLTVLAMDEREIFISVGYGLEGALPDGKVGRILDDYAVPYLQEGATGQALLNTYKALYTETAAEYNWNGEPVEPQAAAENRSDGGVSPVFIIFITIFILLMISRGGGGGFGGPGRRVRRGGFPGTFRTGGFGGSGGGFRGGGGGSAGGGGAGRGW